MNILIAGGPGTFMNKLLVKCHKEGHKVSVLTGNRFTEKEQYQKCFEVYQFGYDANCLNEIFESAAPDVTIFTGAYDVNFKWENEESDAVKFTASLANVLISYVMQGKGRFIYLSSQEVFGARNTSLITEDTTTTPDGFKAQAIFQGETICENYRKNREMDIMTVRFDHIYGVPQSRKDVIDLCSKMCLEALEEKTIHYDKETRVSPLFEGDAVEALQCLIECERHATSLYQISSSNSLSEEDIAKLAREKMDPECTIVANVVSKDTTCILSGNNYESEFGHPNFLPLEKGISKIANHIKSNPYVFLTDENAEVSIWQKLKKKIGWFIRAVIPFVENIIVFIPCFLFYNRTATSAYFANLDIYLLYVLLFAVIFGQQQATISALLAVIGYCFRQTYERSRFDLFLDGNTYVWIAQLFIVGLSVGYLRDQILKIKAEQEEERKYLQQQIEDIQDINTINARVKDVLETQLVNQSDSVGKIFSITSSLDQYSPEEVLFYAAETVGKIMKTKDAAIYIVSNPDYARLFSATSDKARELGNSIKYSKMQDMYDALISNHVFINRKMDRRYPLMANAIFEDGQMKIIIMVWGLSWENMTLGQANQLSVVSALIQNSVLRANRYLSTMEDRRYLEGTQALLPESFKELLEAFLKAGNRGLNRCTVIQFIVPNDSEQKEMALRIYKGLRQTDYFGVLEDGNLYALLPNTDEVAAQMVISRYQEKHIDCNIYKRFEG